MKVIHAVGNKWSNSQKDIFAQFGIQVKEDEFSYIRLDEDLYKSLKARQVFGENPSYSFRTEFTKKEVDEAKHLVFYYINSIGYPQPEDSWEEETFNINSICKVCGMGRIQNKPYRIKKPKLGKKKIFTLNWVFDVLFVEINFYKTILKPLGLKANKVFVGKKNDISETVVQLEIPIAKGPFEPNSLIQNNKCESCGKNKFFPKIAGFFPNVSSKETSPIFLTQEEFGDGGQSYRQIIVTQELKNILIENKAAKWKEFLAIK